MKVLITGADGLLGTNLARELLDREHSVKALIQPGSKSPTLDGLDIEKKSGDLLGSGETLSKAMGGCDAVFHCAAITDQWATPELTWKVNYDGTKAVLDSCLDAGVKKLIFVGSASCFQFGAIDNPGDETSPFPKEYRGVAYMESKHKAMELVNEYAGEHDIEAVTLAPTFLLGPYDSRPSSGELIRQFIVRGLKFTSPGGKNFVYAKDAATAMVNALDRAKSGEIYIMGGGNLTYMDFFGKVAKLANMPPPKIVLPKALMLLGGAAGSAFEKISGRKVMINYTIARLSLCGTYYSPAKAIRELDMPQTPIDSAIEESINSLKKYGHIK